MSWFFSDSSNYNIIRFNFLTKDILKKLERSNNPLDGVFSIVFGSSALDPDRDQNFEVWMEMGGKKISFFIFSLLIWRVF